MALQCDTAAWSQLYLVWVVCLCCRFLPNYFRAMYSMHLIPALPHILSIVQHAIHHYEPCQQVHLTSQPLCSPPATAAP